MWTFVLELRLLLLLGAFERIYGLVVAITLLSRKSLDFDGRWF